MQIEIYYDGYGKVSWREVDGRHFPGRRLFGAAIFSADQAKGNIVLQELVKKLFTVSFRVFNFPDLSKLVVKETSSGMRMETLLTGEMELRYPDGKQIRLVAGQYHFTKVREFSVFFRKQSATTAFICYFSDDILASSGLFAFIEAGRVHELSEDMAQLIDAFLRQDYKGKVRDYFYENSIRELMILHLRNKGALPEKLNNTIVAAVLKADAIISANLEEHYSIPDLAKMTGTNSCTLKKEFRKYFKMGMFERLKFVRLRKARELLAGSELSIKEVSDNTGYQHVASFIRAFKKAFGISPLEWRKKNT